MNQTAFELLGGERRMRLLVDRLYDVMDTDPRAAAIRALHPPDLQRARERLTAAFMRNREEEGAAAPGHDRP